MDLESFINKSVENHIDKMFSEAHAEAETTSGDIFVEQELKIDEIKADLKILILEQVLQNLL